MKGCIRTGTKSGGARKLCLLHIHSVGNDCAEDGNGSYIDDESGSYGEMVVVRLFPWSDHSHGDGLMYKSHIVIIGHSYFCGANNASAGHTFSNVASS